jgi:hypothetical protein
MLGLTLTCSAVFADMMTDTPKLGGDKERIELDITKAQADKLVGVMAGSETLEFVTLDEVTHFLKLCRQFSMTILATAALGRLFKFAPGNPMRLFSIASQWDDITLAKAALLEYDKLSRKQLTEGFPHKDLGDCTTPYLLGLIDVLNRCMRHAEPHDFGRPESINVDVWKRSVRSFAPKR